jgi:hypothetical protein
MDIGQPPKQPWTRSFVRSRQPRARAREYLTRGVCPAQETPHIVHYGVVEIGSFESLLFTVEECNFAEGEGECEEGV